MQRAAAVAAAQDTDAQDLAAEAEALATMRQQAEAKLQAATDAVERREHAAKVQSMLWKLLGSHCL